MVYRITEAWNEKDVSLSWSPASKRLRPFGPVGPADGWHSLDITELYKGWKNGAYDNFGIKLAPTRTDRTNGLFASSDNRNAAIRPKLVITTTGQ